MARVTTAEVLAIMDGCTLTDVSVFINAASAVIDEVFETTDIAVYKEIERWFTAHMIASTVHRTTSDEKLGDASVKYTGQWGKKLESTPYGQMVLLLDTSGKMANTGKASATITAIESFDE